MIELILFLSFTAISALSVYFLKEINYRNGIKGKDINKKSKTIIPESAGIFLLIPLLIGTIYFFNALNYFEIFYWLAAVILISLIGLYDDARNKFLSKPVPWINRAIPIAVIAFGFPFVLGFDLNLILFSGILIALFASLQNTFAGLNGWEVGSGFINSLFIAFLLWSTPLNLMAIILSASILGLLLLNKFPAKVFPGDSGTLLIGSSMAGLLILNQGIELMIIGLLLFIPNIIDFFVLKLLTNTLDTSQHKTKPYALLADGRLAIPSYPDKKTRYDFAKLVLKVFGPLKEWQIVSIIWLAVILNGLIVLTFFGKIAF